MWINEKKKIHTLVMDHQEIFFGGSGRSVKQADINLVNLEYSKYQKQAMWMLIWHISESFHWHHGQRFLVFMRTQISYVTRMNHTIYSPQCCHYSLESKRKGVVCHGKMWSRNHATTYNQSYHLCLMLNWCWENIPPCIVRVWILC